MHTKQDFGRAIEEVWDEYEKEKKRFLTYQRNQRAAWQDKLHKREAELNAEIKDQRERANTLEHRLCRHRWSIHGGYPVPLFVGFCLGLAFALLLGGLT